jgi:hypothetical protein
MDDLQRRFNRAMVSIYETAKRELGYNATRFVQMISEQGGVAVPVKPVETLGGLIYPCGLL